MRLRRRLCGATVVMVLLAGCGGGDDTGLEVSDDSAADADTTGADDTDGTDAIGVADALDTGEADELSSAIVEVIDRRLWTVASGVGEPNTAATGDRVVQGDVVVTDEAGFGELVYADGSFTRVGPDTVVEVRRLQSTVNTSDVNVGLDLGHTFHVVGDLAGGGRFEVATAVALTAVRGTAFSVVCLVRTTCTLVVVEGEVEVTPSGRSPIVVHGGEQVTVDEQGADEVVPAQPDPWVDDNVERGTEPHDPPDDGGQQAAPGSEDEGEPVARPASLDPYMPPSTTEPDVLYADLDDDGVEEIAIGTFDEYGEDGCGTAHLVLLAYDRAEVAWVVQYTDTFEFAELDFVELRLVDLWPSTADQQVAWNMRHYGCGNMWASSTTIVDWDGATVTARTFEGQYAMQEGLVTLWPVSDDPWQGDCVLIWESWDGEQTEEVDVRVVDCPVANDALLGWADTTVEELFAPRGTDVVLDHHGLGVVSFGRLMDDAMVILTEALGPPTSDNTYTARPGEEFAEGYFAYEVRDVGFAGVWVVFLDTGYRRDGQMHFAGWSVGSDGTPYRTPEGMTIGATVEQLRAAYGDDVSIPREEDPCGGGYTFFTAGLGGRLSGHPDDPASRVWSMSAGAGHPC